MLIMTQFETKWHEVLEKRKSWNIASKYKEFDNEHMFLYLAWPSIILDILHIWFLESYTKNDPEIFMNALFTYNHLSFERGKIIQDQSWIPIIHAFAWNDQDLIVKMMTKNRTWKWFADTIYKTLYFLVHKENIQKREEIVNEIQEHINKKNTQFDRFLLTYLLWCLQDDAILVYSSMAWLIKNYKKCKWLLDFSSPLYGHFWLFLHGLYNLQIFLDRNYWLDILFQECPFLWYEFTQVHTTGRHYVDFPNEIQFLGSY